MWIAIITGVLGIIGTLLGVAIAGWMNRIKDQDQFLREKGWKRQQLIREKLEEICKTIEEIETAHMELWSKTLLYLNQGQRIQLESSFPTPRLSMLINFYAPDLKEFLGLLTELIMMFAENVGKAIFLGPGKDPGNIVVDLTIINFKIKEVCSFMTSLSADLGKKCI
jgi:hypothetical protein